MGLWSDKISAARDAGADEATIRSVLLSDHTVGEKAQMGFDAGADVSTIASILDKGDTPAPPTAPMPNLGTDALATKYGMQPAPAPAPAAPTAPVAPTAAKPAETYSTAVDFAKPAPAPADVSTPIQLTKGLDKSISLKPADVVAGAGYTATHLPELGGVALKEIGTHSTNIAKAGVRAVTGVGDALRKNDASMGLLDNNPQIPDVPLADRRSQAEDLVGITDAEAMYKLTDTDLETLHKSGLAGNVLVGAAVLGAQLPEMLAVGELGKAGELVAKYGPKVVEAALPGLVKVFESKGQLKAAKFLTETVSSGLSMGVPAAVQATGEGKTPGEIFGTGAESGLVGMALPPALLAGEALPFLKKGAGHVIKGTALAGATGAGLTALNPNATPADFVSGAMTFALLHLGTSGLPELMTDGLPNARAAVKAKVGPEELQAAILKDFEGKSDKEKAAIKKRVGKLLDARAGKALKALNVRTGIDNLSKKDATPSPEADATPSTEADAAKAGTTPDKVKSPEEIEMEQINANQVALEAMDNPTVVPDILRRDVGIKTRINDLVASGKITAEDGTTFLDMADNLRSKTFGLQGRTAADKALNQLVTMHEEGKLSNIAEIAIDIVNLGRANTIYGHDGSNDLLKALFAVAKPYLDKLVDNKTSFQEAYVFGGDELGVHVVNVPTELVRKAATDINQAISAFVETTSWPTTGPDGKPGPEVPLRDLLHPKHDDLQTGAGHWNVGVSDIASARDAIAENPDLAKKRTVGGVMATLADAKQYEMANARIKTAVDKGSTHVYTTEKDETGKLKGKAVSLQKAADAETKRRVAAGEISQEDAAVLSRINKESIDIVLGQKNGGQDEHNRPDAQGMGGAGGVRGTPSTGGGGGSILPPTGDANNAGAGATRDGGSGPASGADPTATSGAESTAKSGAESTAKSGAESTATSSATEGDAKPPVKSEDELAASAAAKWKANREGIAARGKVEILERLAQLKRAVIDVNSPATDPLAKLPGGKAAVRELHLSRGASGAAEEEIRTVLAGTIGRLKHKDVVDFGEFRANQSVVELDRVRDEQNRPRLFHPHNITGEEAAAALSKFKREDPKRYAQFEKIDEKFQKAMSEETLTYMEGNGLISKELKDHLLDLYKHYNLRSYLDHLDTMVRDVAGGRTTQVSESGIKKLEYGSTGDLVTDPEYLLTQVKTAAYNRGFKNDANKALFGVVSNNPDNPMGLTVEKPIARTVSFEKADQIVTDLQGAVLKLRERIQRGGRITNEQSLRIDQAVESLHDKMNVLINDRNQSEVDTQALIAELQGAILDLKAEARIPQVSTDFAKQIGVLDGQIAALKKKGNIAGNDAETLRLRQQRADLMAKQKETLSGAEQGVIEAGITDLSKETDKTGKKAESLAPEVLAEKRKTLEDRLEKAKEELDASGDDPKKMKKAEARVAAIDKALEKLGKKEAGAGDKLEELSAKIARLNKAKEVETSKLQGVLSVEGRLAVETRLDKLGESLNALAKERAKFLEEKNALKSSAEYEATRTSKIVTDYDTMIADLNTKIDKLSRGPKKTKQATVTGPEGTPVTGDVTIAKEQLGSKRDKELAQLAREKADLLTKAKKELSGPEINALESRAGALDEKINIWADRVTKAQTEGTKEIELPSKTFAPLPKGQARITSWEKGERQAVLAPEEFANSWVQSDPVAIAPFTNLISWISGVRFVKPIATALNPAFLVTNIPRDVVHIAYVTQEYHPVMQIAALQIAKDMLKVLPDVWTRTGRYKEAVAEGIASSTITSRVLPPVKITEGMSQAKKVFLGARNLASFLAETSELVTRIALRERTLKNLQKKIDSGEMTREEAGREATHVARNYMDYNQGGNYSKAFDSVFPFLSASIQGNRGIARAARENPKLFAFKTATIAAQAALLTYYNEVVNKDAMDKIDDRTKVSNWILTTPLSYFDENEEERHIYFKIAKEPAQAVVCAIGDLIGEVRGGRKANAKKIQMALDKAAIVDAGIITSTPWAGAAFAALNINAYTKGKYWYGPEVEYSQEFEPGKTPEAYQALAKVAGAISIPGVFDGKNNPLSSPSRLKGVSESFLPNNNPAIKVLGGSYRNMLNGVPEPERKALHKGFMAFVELSIGKMSELPFTDRIFGVTKPTSARRSLLVEEAFTLGMTGYEGMTLPELQDAVDTETKKQNADKQVNNRKADDLLQKGRANGNLDAYRAFLKDLQNQNPKEYARLVRRKEVKTPDANTKAVVKATSEGKVAIASAEGRSGKVAANRTAIENLKKLLDEAKKDPDTKSRQERVALITRKLTALSGALTKEITPKRNFSIRDTTEQDTTE